MKLKLKERLPKLHIKKKQKYKHYRYHLFVNKEAFDHLTLTGIYNVNMKDEVVDFDCNKEIIKKLDNEEVEYKKIDRVKHFFQRNSHKATITIIFLIFNMIIFFINQFLIREIIFEDDKYKNDLVYEYVESYSKKLGPYIVLNDSIANISKELRRKFYQYAYIGLNKRGSKLIIEIVYQDIQDNQKKDDQKIGEYYANADATISYINLSSGQVVIKYNDVVKKGDLIATSNLQYLDNLYSRDKMVPLVGEILGNVKEYYEIEVLKNEEVEFFNGNKQQFYTLDFSKKILFSKKNPYENYFITKYTLFKIGKFQVVKNIIYEKDTASVIRTKKEAQDYALIQIYQDYEANRTSKKEKIDSIQLINFIEYEDRYYFKFIVSACKNIVEFKPF